jgi:hypothetical protein
VLVLVLVLVLVEDSAQTLVSAYVQPGDLLRVGDRRRQRIQRAGVRDALVRSMLVEEGFELAQGMEQVALVPDQRPVEQFTTARLHPVGARNSATLCDLGIFMDEPAEPVAPNDLDIGVDGVG